jgi:hypothetical protein
MMLIDQKLDDPGGPVNDPANGALPAPPDQNRRDFAPLILARFNLSPDLRLLNLIVFIETPKNMIYRHSF